MHRIDSRTEAQRAASETGHTWPTMSVLGVWDVGCWRWGVCIVSCLRCVLMGEPY